MPLVQQDLQNNGEIDYWVKNNEVKEKNIQTKL